MTELDVDHDLDADAQPDSARTWMAPRIPSSTPQAQIGEPSL
jgi:hypothetical protein